MFSPITRTVGLTALLALGAPGLALAADNKLPGAATTATVAPTDVQALGRQYVALYYAGNIDAVWEHFTPEMRAAMSSKAEFSSLQQRMVKGLGREQSVVTESVEAVGTYRVYTRSVVYANAPGKFDVVFSLDGAGAIAGFYISALKEPAASKFLDYHTQADLRLPFSGHWTVLWGGRTVKQNYHAAYPDQRFAYDMSITRAGATHRGDGKQLKDYYCYGEKILAPAAGVVLEVANDVPDNVPGVLSTDRPVGNHVIIDMGHHEYCFLAHMQPGSVKVHVGETISRGQWLGLCGNSGHTSEPHLHLHLQTTPVFEAGRRGEGLPAEFRHYFADGRPVELGEPVRFQEIWNAP